MKYYLLEVESDKQDSCTDSEIKELVSQYLYNNNISAKCIINNYTFLSINCKQQNGILKKIRQDSIIYIEKQEHKVLIYTHEGCYDFYSSLKKLQEKLDPQIFFRVHQGYIVNINEIKILYTNELSLLSCDRIIPVSRRNRAFLDKKTNLS